jgi:hypothetical protein
MQEIIMSFFSKIEAKLKSMFKAVPKIETIALSAIDYSAPAVEEMVGLVSGTEAEAEAKAILDRIMVGLAALHTTISAGEDSGGSPTAILASLQADLGQIEGVANIVNPATKAKFASAVAIVNGEVQAISGALTGSGQTPAPAAAKTPVVIQTVTG